ncbi:hypothetical protein HYQ03_gp64 [Arthrobacter phage Kuleana]|uniref:Uncharacterized protein n=1 Tax=Arthrobacter phage Kuleana TaxID=2653270 RepID=A0A5Q2WC56_9CAUD|nr:hypothetical protein HYQ03_gp64 [Arthrobacter phage Kuleana]QGH74551.1 hypothetical protein SEA_KULEANA_64 [Arthrobacter phage Kuleana]
MCRVCKHTHYSTWTGTLCGAVRWSLVGIYWRSEVCDCRGHKAVWSWQ